MNYEEFWHPLTALYAAGEAKAIARMVLEMGFGLSMTDILCGKVTNLSADDQQKLQEIQKRLLTGEPVQYVLGVAEFCGRLFHVEPGVLIPRPETEELCHLIIRRYGGTEVRGYENSDATEGKHAPTYPRTHVPTRILDIGTGSGCIACTLAAELPDAEVTAWDISDEALRIAQDNARRLGVNVKFEKVDILSTPLPHREGLGGSLIISNPPYICEKERKTMERNVLDHEPELALFVPDDDPLLFYRAIASYGRQALQEGGRLYFEINPLYADDLQNMLSKMSYHDIETKADQFGKQRFISACK